MGGTSRKPDENKPGKRGKPPPPALDDNDEDGDIATPKRDRDDPEDEPA